MKFGIYKLDLPTISDTGFFRVDYTIEDKGDQECKLEFEIFDTAFNLSFFKIEVTPPSEGCFFVGYDTGGWYGIKFGFRMVVKCDGEIIHDRVYDYCPLAWLDSLRDKTCWLIGDSHCDSTFGQEPKIGDFNFTRIRTTSLSLNRFLNSDYLRFLRRWPIKREDIIVFHLGEIDFRYAIHRYVEKHDKETFDACSELLQRYLKFLIETRAQFPYTRIIVTSPVPPMRDGFLKDLISGTEENRKLCWSLFDYFFRVHEFEYLDWTESYRLNDSMVDTSKLMERDHHIENYAEALEELTHKIIGNGK